MARATVGLTGQSLTVSGSRMAARAAGRAALANRHFAQACCEQAPCTGRGFAGEMDRRHDRLNRGSSPFITSLDHVP